MATKTIIAEYLQAGLPYIGDKGIEWATVHNAANATSVENGGMTGQSYWHHASWPYWYWRIWRDTAIFNTASLDGLIILSAKLQVRKAGIAVANPDTQHLIVVSGADLSEAGIVVADYGDLLDETTILGEITADDYTDVPNGTFADIPLNAAGLATLNIPGYAKFGLRGERDILGLHDEILAANNWFTYSSPYDVFEARRPKLVVTYKASLNQAHIIG